MSVPTSLRRVGGHLLHRPIHPVQPLSSIRSLSSVYPVRLSSGGRASSRPAHHAARPTGLTSTGRTHAGWTSRSAHTGRDGDRVFVRFLRPPFFRSRRALVAGVKFFGGIYLVFTVAALVLESLEVTFTLEDEDEDANQEGQADGVIDSRFGVAIPTFHRRQTTVTDQNGDVMRQEYVQDDDAEYDDEDDEEEEGLDPGELVSFIVWSIPKQLPREWYKATDAEWQEYTKLSRNPKKVRAIKAGLTSIVRQKFVIPALGQVDYKIGRSWLEFVFPYGPPPLYEVSGIGIYKNFVVVGDTTITEDPYARLKHMFMPVGIVAGSYALARNLVTSRYNTLKAKITGEPEPTDSVSPSTGSAFPDRMISKSDPNFTYTIPDMPIPIDEADSGTPRNVFLQSIRAARLKHQPKEPPQGTCIITGKVEVVGSKGRSLLDVTAVYDPLESAFVRIEAQVHLIQPHKQSPKESYKSV